MCRAGSAPSDPWASPVGKLGEAFLIAGVLALAVDRSLKRELLVDAARGLFVHMLGFDQQPAIKQELAKITFTTKLYIGKNRLFAKSKEPRPGE